MDVKFFLRVALLALLASAAQAQNYPTKPINMVVPFSAGGPTDTLGRTIAQAMTTALKQTVIIENVGGAGGNIGVDRVAKARPDGYTILLHHIGMSTSPALYRKLNYNPLTDFEYIGLVADVPMTLIAKQNFPAKDFKELLAYVKANKDKVTLANAGLGSASHLCGLLLMSTIQTEMTTVPYKGTAPAINDLLGGQVDLLCDQTTNTTQYISSGRVKAYGATTSKRLDTMKDLPTLSELGLPGFEVAVWHGVYAPKGTPKPVVDKLVAAMQAAIVDPQFVQRMNDLGAQVVSKEKATPAGFRAHLTSEINKWTPIIKKAGVYAD